MTADHFQVHTPTLRSVAARLGDRADTAGAISDKAKEADVDEKSWGALGLGLGLYSGYTSARTSADRSIGEISSFLTDARSALEASARDYDEADQAGGQLFGTIHDRMSGGAQ